MKSPDRVEKLLVGLEDHTSPVLDDRVLRDVFAVMDSTSHTAASRPWPGVGRAIVKSKATGLAAAVILVGGLFLLVWHWVTKPSVPEQLEQPSPVAHQAEQGVNPSLSVSEQIALARGHYEQRNQSGLLDLLARGAPETQIEIAGMLAEVGDASSIGPLLSLSGTWQGDPGENPFQAAIARIRARIESSDTDPNEPDLNESRPEEPKSRLNETGQSSARSESGIAGRVIDKLTLKPIADAVVSPSASDLQSSAKSDAQGGFRLVGLKAATRRFIYVTAAGYTSRRLTIQVSPDTVQDNLQIELSRGSSLTGTVKDPQGQPLRGAEVRTFYFTGRPTVTDGRGSYRLDGLNPIVDQYSLHVTHPDYPAVSHQFNPAALGETATLNVTLNPGVNVFGRVTGPRGEPLEGVRVGNTRSGAMWNSIQVKTDDQGRYRLDRVAQGKLTLWAVHGDFALHVQETQTGQEPEVEINIALQTPTPLRGRVLDAAGHAMPDVRVLVFEYNHVTNLARQRYRTDHEGRFVIANAPDHGEIHLRFYARDTAGHMEVINLDGGVDEHVITLSRDGRIYGRVLDDTTGKPIEHFTVKMTVSQVEEAVYGYAASWNREGHAFSSPQGHFDTGGEDLALGVGYRITVVAEGHDRLTRDPVFVQQTSEDPNRALFRLSPATVLSGAVVDANGLPIADATVAFFSKANRNNSPYWTRCTTDELGVFVISGIDARENNVQVTAPGFALFAADRASLRASPDEPLRIVLNRGGRIVGSVIGETGEALIGARLRVYQAMSGPLQLSREVRTDDQGTYEFSRLPEGLLRVSLISQQGESLARKEVSIVAGQTQQVNFGDGEGFIVRGTVRRGPAPIPGARVSASMADKSSRTSVTDAQGLFQIRNVPQGITRINIIAQDRAGGITESRNVHITTDRWLDVDFGAGSISGTIPSAFRHTKGLRVRVQRWAMEVYYGSASTVEGYWKGHSRAGETNEIQAGGRFTCPGLSAGQYHLVLMEAERTLAITDELSLGESEQLAGIRFRTGDGRLALEITDAVSGAGIPAAQFMIANEFDWPFMDKQHVTEGQYAMVTDDQGRMTFHGLPPGQYRVFAKAAGYLWGTTARVQANTGATTTVTLALAPAALVDFTLSARWQEALDTDSVWVKCSVTDLSTNTPVPSQSGPRSRNTHDVSMPADGLTPPAALLHLPPGHYRLDYQLCPYYPQRHTVGAAIHSGSFTVEIETGTQRVLLIE